MIQRISSFPCVFSTLIPCLIRNEIKTVWIFADGPLKISDNNIENVYNININIHGEFNLSLDQDIVQVIVALLNQEETSIGGQTLRDQLVSLVKSIASTQKNQPEQAMNIDIPLGKNFDIVGIPEKIREALQQTSQLGESWKK